MTFEACNQLKEIMSFSGFPDECLAEPSYLDSSDSRLDIITSLLAYALSPNVCFHVEKRKLITSDGKHALINKNSVNCGRTGETIEFTSPFFVFGEKIKTKCVSAKQMTMTTPLQLLLFAAEKIETVPNEKEQIVLDNWISLKIEIELASIITSIRTAIDSVIARCTILPTEICNPGPDITHFIETFRMLSDQDNKHVFFRKVEDSTASSSNCFNTSFTNQPEQYATPKEFNYQSSQESNEPVKKRINADTDTNVFNNNKMDTSALSSSSLQNEPNDSNVPAVGFFMDKRGGFFNNNNFNRGGGFNNSRNSFQYNNQSFSSVPAGQPLPPHLMQQSSNSNFNTNQQFNSFNNNNNRGGGTGNRGG